MRPARSASVWACRSFRDADLAAELPLVVLVGPTASGKSALAMELAARDGRLIVPDSDGPVRERRKLMQVGMAMVAITLTPRGDILGYPQVALDGVPQDTDRGEAMYDVALDAVEKALDDLTLAALGLGQREHAKVAGVAQRTGNRDDPLQVVGQEVRSIGCPALRPEAFVAPRLDAQMDDGMNRFMSDPTRNRYADGRAELSEIFKWFGEDFQKGHRGIGNLNDLVLRYADALNVPMAERAAIRGGSVRIRYLDYDWSLNDIRR